MNFEHIKTVVKAPIVNKRERIERTFELYPEVEMYVAFIDVSGNSNYRIAYGSLDGYLRTETFFDIVKETINYTSVILLKEIGDEVMLISEGFKELFESVVIILALVEDLRLYAGTEARPLAARAAIGGGALKRLKREKLDYVGTPIDRLARVMSIKDADSNFLVDKGILDDAKLKELKEYGGAIQTSEVTYLSNDQKKGMIEEVGYVKVFRDRKGLIELREKFEPWSRF